MRGLLLFILTVAGIKTVAQQKPYYYQIPDTPKTYTAATVAARMVDGLGFRYFWATEGLKETDLLYKPSKDARTSLETLKHIKELTDILFNAISKKPTDLSVKSVKFSFTELREKTLENIRLSAELLKGANVDPEEMDIIFQKGEMKQAYPFWNLLNGPIADALWHVGQIVSFRRASGNPLPPGVSVLNGTKTNTIPGND